LFVIHYLFSCFPVVQGNSRHTATTSKRMKESFTRRDFIKSAAAAGMGLGLPALASEQPPQGGAAAGRVGIIGLDTSHSVAFTKLLNAPDAGADLGGYRVVAAYPKGSPDIESSVSRCRATRRR
jgi:hypothetical protein